MKKLILKALKFTALKKINHCKRNKYYRHLIQTCLQARTDNVIHTFDIFRPVLYVIIKYILNVLRLLRKNI